MQYLKVPKEMNEECAAHVRNCQFSLDEGPYLIVNITKCELHYKFDQ